MSSTTTTQAQSQTAQTQAQQMPIPTIQEPVQPKLESIMSRPRPMTRRFYLDRPDLDSLCGPKGVDRLRSKIPQLIIERQRSTECLRLQAKSS